MSGSARICPQVRCRANNVTRSKNLVLEEERWIWTKSRRVGVGSVKQFRTSEREERRYRRRENVGLNVYPRPE